MIIERQLQGIEPARFERTERVITLPPKTHKTAVTVSLLLPDYQTVSSQPEGVLVTKSLLEIWRMLRRDEPIPIAGSHEMVDRINHLIASTGWQTIRRRIEEKNTYQVRRLFKPDANPDSEKIQRREHLDYAVAQILHEPLRHFAAIAEQVILDRSPNMPVEELIQIIRLIVTDANLIKSLSGILDRIIMTVPNLIKSSGVSNDSSYCVNDDLSALALLCLVETYSDITNPSSGNHIPYGSALSELIRKTIGQFHATSKLGALLSNTQYQEPVDLTKKEVPTYSVAQLQQWYTRLLFYQPKLRSSTSLGETVSVRVLPDFPPELIGYIGRIAKLNGAERTYWTEPDDFTYKILFETFDWIMKNIEDKTLRQFLDELIAIDSKRAGVKSSR